MFYIKSNKNKLDSIETWHTVIPQTRVPSLPGLISMAQVSQWRTTDVTRVLKAPDAELCQNAYGVVNE